MTIRHRLATSMTLSVLVLLATTSQSHSQDSEAIAEGRELVRQERSVIFGTMHPTAKLMNLYYHGYEATTSGFHLEYTFQFQGMFDVRQSRIRLHFDKDGRLDRILTRTTTSLVDPFFATDTAIAVLKEALSSELGSITQSQLVQSILDHVDAKRALSAYLQYRQKRLEGVADNPTDGELLRLLQGSESVDAKERAYWTSTLPRMSVGQRKQLRKILIEEKEALAKFDKKGEEELRFKGKAETDNPTDEELKRLLANSKSVSKEEREDWIRQLPDLNANQRRELKGIFLDEIRQLNAIKKVCKPIDDAFSQKDYSRAVSLLNEAITKDPTSVELIYQRARAREETKEYALAITDLDRAIELAPSSSQVFYFRGYVLSEIGRHLAARGDYLRSVQISPESPQFRNGLAWVLATAPESSCRDGRLAIEHATKACELTKWRESYYFDTLAAAYAEAGDYAKAVEWQSKAVTDSEFQRRVGAEEYSRAKERLGLFKVRKPWRSASTDQSANGYVSSPSEPESATAQSRKPSIWIWIVAGSSVLGLVIIAFILVQIRAARRV